MLGQETAAPSLAVGARCKFVGLVAQAALNGKQCMVLAVQAADGRRTVEVDPVMSPVFPDFVVEASCKVRAKAENLVLLEPGRALPSSYRSPERLGRRRATRVRRQETSEQAGQHPCL